nr:RNA-directed DNA polymerase, eukaryota [Tanacetum cinerariifolium]
MTLTRFGSDRTTCSLQWLGSTKTIPPPKQYLNHPLPKQTRQQKKSPHSTHTNPNQSHVNVLNGKGPNNIVPNPKNILKSVTLDESDLINTSGIKNVILAKVRDVHLIPNINIVLNKEGFFGFQCKYIGGMWIWIEFESNEACLKLQANKEMSWYFTHLKHIHNSFILDERVVWIEIGGLPLNAWTPNAFKKIAESWGTPLFVDEDPNETVSIGRVCIKTKIHGHINENCKVIIFGKPYNASVREFAGWAPDIQSIDTTPSYNSNSNRFSCGGSHQSPKQPSHYSSAPVKPSRVRKSQTKSFGNQGSMIEAFVSHIEMGKVLGFDMEGSKNDLKKFIDSLGARQGY